MEKVFYKTSPEWYKGSQPTFYNTDNHIAAKVLKENYEILKKEITEFYFENSDQLKTNFTPYEYREEGWKTLNLYSYLYKQHDNINKFPVLNKIVSSIPNMWTCQIAVMKPGTRLKAHMGDTSAGIRYHLGIVVPGKLPDIGIKVGREDRDWEEGEVFAFCIAHRHYAWNYTENYRIALIVDVIRDEYSENKFWIGAMTLAGITLRVLGIKFRVFKHVPKFVSKICQYIIACAFRIVLFLQWKFGIKVEKLIH